MISYIFPLLKSEKRCSFQSQTSLCHAQQWQLKMENPSYRPHNPRRIFPSRSINSELKLKMLSVLVLGFIWGYIYFCLTTQKVHIHKFTRLNTTEYLTANFIILQAIEKWTFLNRRDTHSLAPLWAQHTLINKERKKAVGTQQHSKILWELGLSSLF